MKNVTITMDDAVADWVRVEAAKRNKSMSRLIAEVIGERMRQDDAYERAMQEWIGRSVTYVSDGRAYPTREQTYAERVDRFR